MLMLLVLLVFGPMVYAAVMPSVSDRLGASWFTDWARVTASLSRPLSVFFPGLETAASRRFGIEQSSAFAFRSFASLDLLCIIGASFALLTLLPSPRLRPKPGGMQLRFLRDLTQGFPIRRFSLRTRVGGAGGGVLAAFFVCTLILWALDALYIAPMQDGRFFDIGESACNAAAFSGAANLAVQSTNANADLPGDCLHQAVWRLAWKSSIAGMAIPIGLLIALNYAIYPIWLMRGRPTAE